MYEIEERKTKIKGSELNSNTDSWPLLVNQLPIHRSLWV